MGEFGKAGGLDPVKVGDGGAIRRLILSTIVLGDGECVVLPFSSLIFSVISTLESTSLISGTFVTQSCYRNETKSCSITLCLTLDQ